MSGDCERCGHPEWEHDVTAFGDPLGCDVVGCECPEYIEPEENE